MTIGNTTYTKSIRFGAIETKNIGILIIQVTVPALVFLGIFG